MRILFILIKITLVNDCTPFLVLWTLNICMVKVLKIVLHLYARFPAFDSSIVSWRVFLLWLFRFSKIIENIFNLCKFFLNWRFLDIRNRRFWLNKLSSLQFTIKHNRPLTVHLKLIWSILLMLINLNWAAIKNIIFALLINILNTSLSPHIYLRLITLKIVIFFFLYVWNISSYNLLVIKLCLCLDSIKLLRLLLKIKWTLLVAILILNIDILGEKLLILGPHLNFTTIIFKC